MNYRMPDAIYALVAYLNDHITPEHPQATWFSSREAAVAHGEWISNGRGSVIGVYEYALKMEDHQKRVGGTCHQETQGGRRTPRRAAGSPIVAAYHERNDAQGNHRRRLPRAVREPGGEDMRTSDYDGRGVDPPYYCQACVDKDVRIRELEQIIVEFWETKLPVEFPSDEHVEATRRLYAKAERIKERQR